MQLAALAAAVYLPLVQDGHERSVVAEAPRAYVPAAHVLLVHAVAPTVTWSSPTAQGVHCGASDGALECRVPAGHVLCVQLAWPAAGPWPAGQTPQPVPSALYMLAGQASHPGRAKLHAASRDATTSPGWRRSSTGGCGERPRKKRRRMG